MTAIEWSRWVDIDGQLPLFGDKEFATYIVQEQLPPSLVLPEKLGRTLESNKELPLEVEELVEIGKEKVYRILVDHIALG